MPIPTEPVGSLPRPMKLQQAYAAYDAGKITHAQLEAEQDEACRDSIQRMEATGSPIVSDGEQRASSFATYPITDTLGGTGLAPNLAADGQYFAIFTDGHHRQLPRLTGGPFKYKTFAADYLKKSIKMATKPMKQAVIAPSMLALLYPLDGEVPGYSRDQFLSDLCDECEQDIRAAFAAGAVRVSVDFTEGRLACRNDPNNPWTGRGMLSHFVELNNRVLDRFTPEERKNIGIHTCPGGDCDATHSADVDYADLLPSMFQMNAGYFLIQLASEPDKERVYKLIGEHSRADANGVPQVCFIGVINPQNPRVETPEEVCADLMLASKYIPKERLGATDDCGFSPFSIDVKPKHGSPDVARDIAFQKITARIKGVQMASEKLGLTERRGGRHGTGGAADGVATGALHPDPEPQPSEPAMTTSPRPRRSFLFAPGTNPSMFPKAIAAGPDIMCVDLEDAIAPQHKAAARQGTLAWFESFLADQTSAPSTELLVRVNGLRSADGLADILAIIAQSHPPPGLMLPKIKSPDEIRLLDELLTAEGKPLRFQVIIETNEGLDACHEIARASERIDSLLFGGVDMAAELRVEPTWEALLYARSRLVHAAASAGVDLIDVPFLDLQDLDALDREAGRAAAIGMTGKGAIHPKQLPIIERHFTPTADQIAEARKVIAAFEQAGTGLVVIDGKLIEKPVLRNMGRILTIADRIER